LVTWAKFRGWCDATPKGAKKPNRLERGNTPELLDEDDESLVEDLEALGFSMSGTQGTNPLTFGEVKAWSDMIGASLSARAVEWLILMSRVYVGQKTSLDGEAATPPPWHDANFDRSKVSDAVEKMFKGQGNTVTKTPAKET
jgi:hypothetical protein